MLARRRVSRSWCSEQAASKTPLRYRSRTAMGDEEEEKAPPREVLVLNVGQYVGANVSKRFAASEDDNFQVIGTQSQQSQRALSQHTSRLFIVVLAH